MQKKTGSFKEDFSKNAYYRFLRGSHSNWLRFTTLLSEKIVNEHLRGLTALLSMIPSTRGLAINTPNWRPHDDTGLDRRMLLHSD